MLLYEASNAKFNAVDYRGILLSTPTTAVRTLSARTFCENRGALGAAAFPARAGGVFVGDIDFETRFHVA